MCCLWLPLERRGDLEAYLRRVMFNQQLNQDPLVLNFLNVSAKQKSAGTKQTSS